MPELPEVEFARRLAAEVLVGRTLVTVVAQEDPIVFDGCSAALLSQRLEGRKVLEACRWGKYCWLRLDAGPSPVFHFGMTGAFRVAGHKPLKLAAHGMHVDEAWPPRFAKVHLTTSEGAELVFTNARRFGRLFFRDNPKTDAPVSKLGFDPLLNLPNQGVFLEQLRRRKAVVKSVLLNQSFAAGVGNWIADEVLFQAGIDPRRHVPSLEAFEISRIREALDFVIRTAVAVNGRKDQFPESWLFHRRWGKGKHSKTHAGDAIEFTTIAGRTTAWVPAKQH